MLSYDDFVAKAKADIDRCGSPPHRLKLDEPVFYVEWVTGGQEGGSCWGGEPYSRSPEKEPELDALMELLDDLDLRLRHANQILKEMETGTYEDRGYYGNWTEYGYKYITLSKVHEKLAEFGYVEPAPGRDARP